MRAAVLQTQRPAEKEEEGGASGANSSAPCGADHDETGCGLQPMEVHGGVEAHLQAIDVPMLQQVDTPGRRL